MNPVFNPSYVNHPCYPPIQSQSMAQYQKNQDAQVQKIVKATHDLMEAARNLDSEHQREAAGICLAIIAAELSPKNSCQCDNVGME